MSRTFRLQILAPEGLQLDVETDSVCLPALDGALGVMGGHAPMLAAPAGPRGALSSRWAVGKRVHPRRYWGDDRTDPGAPAPPRTVPGLIPSLETVQERRDPTKSRRSCFAGRRGKGRNTENESLTRHPETPERGLPGTMESGVTTQSQHNTSTPASAAWRRARPKAGSVASLGVKARGPRIWMRNKMYAAYPSSRARCSSCRCRVPRIVGASGNSASPSRSRVTPFTSTNPRRDPVSR